jgi:hypothetical protein
MAYETGVVSSFSDLQGRIVSFLVANGWTQEGNIVKKSGVVAEVTAGANPTHGYSYLRLIGAKSTDGAGNLVDIPTRSDGSLFDHNSSKMQEHTQPGAYTDLYIAWPISYFLHLGTDPDEFWCFIQFNGNYCQHMGFGNLKKSADYSGGQFYTATFNDREAQPGSFTAGGATFKRIGLDTTDTVTTSGSAIIPFAKCSPFGAIRPSSGCMVRAEIQDRSWFTGYISPATDYASGASADATLDGGMLQYQRDVSNDGPDPKAQTIPFRIYGMMYSGNWQFLGSVNNLRFSRIDGKTFGEVYDDGTEKWKFYPVFLKEEAVPDPVNYVVHSGTYGLAVRYDGA